ncbi:phosphoserine transaminase [Corynebacterium sp. ES2794-CONJ1]|uniref:phosphoserine transaminase n=1 Tax=unclassified Corynebacterium TaxID=2624378 RepID=UPI002168C340|nr:MULTISPECIES: phosphoserine transaminase [unclassified Corynebacterium]MCS4490054.1 phosphoserine transaminase [Corynebacterium sp. ES2775-CONJ]MCS4491584.1 phosphoserine transaminase [Corynebacterium sp. ES2715-CONJ3]MCS4531688.1 phosphoserine transaminase [Corynebacterium sp. ES2730-CONJ]MCU9519084.1 phosphoserine transaminase [Corynebacterium sp. ES2794-CONJ1]
MSETPRIPAHLLPHDGRFGCGPSKVRPAQVDAVAAGARTVLGTSHRQSAIKDIVGSIRTGLSQLFNLPEGHEVILGLGGATAFWDAATFGLIRKKSGHLVCGEFSSKFATAAAQAPWLDQPAIISAEPGKIPTPGSHDFDGCDVIAWAHNETSTGAMIPTHRPAAPEDALTVIDATSGAGGLPADLNAVDVYYFSPQKCFAADGGLWIAIMSPRALDRVEEIAKSGRYIPEFLNLKTAVNNSRKNQTYNTPAVATLIMLAEQVKWMNELGGLDAMVERTRRNSDTLYAWAENHPHAQPFVSEPSHRSLVVGTIDFDDSVDAAALAKILRAHGIVDVEPYRKLGRNQLRVGLFPAIDAADIHLLTQAIDHILDHR